MSDLTRTTKAGTQYLTLDAYEEVDGVLTPKKGSPVIASSAVAASAKASKGGAASAAAAAAAPAADAELQKLFLSIGLSETKCAETIKNAELSADLKGFILAAGGNVDKAHGNLLYEVAARHRAMPRVKLNVDFLVKKINSKAITTKAQLEEAFNYLKSNDSLDGFDSAVGIGASVTPEQIASAVAAVLADNKAEVAEKRYRTNTGKLMGIVREKLKWADVKLIKDELDNQLAKILGPRTEEDNSDKPKKKAAAPAAAPAAAAAAAAPKAEAAAAKGGKAEEEEDMTFAGAAAHFHEPGHNDETEGYVVTPNTKTLLKKHLESVGGKVRTRFPPESNGILHIGHAKAMNFNFSYAKSRGGETNLRYDDTNPEKEEEEFFNGILRDVTWLGHKPARVTYASDTFQQLYEWAIYLIKNDKAYVCHQKVEEIRGFDIKESPWRSRPIEESLKLFEDMKNGRIDEGEATLRLKHEMKDGKLDPVAYRVKFHEHHRTKDEWCIYPTYDYTHCLDDSIENITHSLCTKEFQNRRPSYYWLCNALDIYCPVQWEYSRLNMQYTVVSKRKIATLIEKGYVKSWDDPRLFTLSALRRRGFPPQAINNFCNKLGVTVALSVLSPDKIESAVRDYLNASAVRAMAVLDPLRIVIVNFPDDKVETIKVPNNPTVENSPTHTVPFSKVIYIEADDFTREAVKGFKRLTPSQSVGLKHAGFVITVDKIVTDGDDVVEVQVKAEKLTEANKPKAFIHWVSGKDSKTKPAVSEVRLYERLFLHPNPEDHGFLKDINPDSLRIVDAYVDDAVKGAKPETVFQFERIGYFCVDADSTDKKMVFNRTVALKEDSSKVKDA